MKTTILILLLAATGFAQWKPVGGRLMTRWAADVDPARPLPEYPRPHMTRPRWLNLNGLWSYAVTEKSAGRPASFRASILVPFPLESALSGVKQPLLPSQALWYRRSFAVPAGWQGQRVLLHFGAVDWHATVFVNGARAGEHKGGYTPFWFDITPYLKGPGEQELVVSVTDPTDSWTQPRGKQVRNPAGIWYTSVSGIWQTVWLEPVPQVFIRRLKAEPDIDAGRLRLTVETSDNANLLLEAVALDGQRPVARSQGVTGKPLELPMPGARLWSPESPHLYDLQVTLRQGTRTLDSVGSYFAMRKISLGPDPHGRLRMLLNNQPYFQAGPLDQGWWPDGLYTAPTEEALRFDIEFTRRIGFNMARKHVKVEPARWYYHCDRLGLLVWQDMPNGHLHGDVPNHLRVQPGAPDATRPPDSAAQFEAELKELITALEHFPSIVVWVPFNEGWGQYDTERITKLVRSLDSSRLVNPTSGWTDRGVGDMRDTHIYPGPGMEPGGPGRAAVLGEFGGVSMPVEGHLWATDRNWGYATRTKPDELLDLYRTLFRNTRGLLARGLSALVYTQTTDVESEVNGYLTYDRAVEKLDASELRRIHAPLYQPVAPARTIFPDAGEQPQIWRYSTVAPPAGWAGAAFDASGWNQGPGGFFSGPSESFRLGTPWPGEAIWVRREFELASVPGELWLTLLHGADHCEVFLNGERVLQTSGLRPSRRHYTHFDLTTHARLLRAGKNVLALHARHAQGWRGIDAGLYTIDAPSTSSAVKP